MPTCSKCDADSIVRSRTKHTYEKWIGSIGVQPFRCRYCHHRFYAFNSKASAYLFRGGLLLLVLAMGLVLQTSLPTQITASKPDAPDLNIEAVPKALVKSTSNATNQTLRSDTKSAITTDNAPVLKPTFSTTPPGQMKETTTIVLQNHPEVPKPQQSIKLATNRIDPLHNRTIPENKLLEANILPHEKTEKPASNKAVLLNHLEIKRQGRKNKDLIPEQVSTQQHHIAVPDFEKDVLATAQGWAKAWSDKDVDAYFNFYHPDFKPTGNKSRSSWKKQRRERITKPHFIAVEIKTPLVTLLNNNKIIITFYQNYRSNTYSDEVRKSLEMEKSDGTWKIIGEK